MVRRRVRTAHKAAGVVASSGELLTNGFVNGQLLEDQYFASPKRKDCKIDNDALQEVGDILPEELETKTFDFKDSHDQKTKIEREDDIAGRPIGVPLATRSQTKTIENFFKAKTAAKSAKLKATDEEKTYNLTTLPPAAHSPPLPLDQFVLNGHAAYPTIHNYDEHEHVDVHGACGMLQPAFMFDLNEDTNDTDHTELSDETASGGGAAAIGIDFSTHRSSSLRDSHSSTRSSSSTTTTTDNIFLQEPVLSLNVEWTADQAAASIKINKSLEVEPVFSSPPRLTAAALNGPFNQIVSLYGSPVIKRESFGFESKAAAMLPYLLPDNENNSCDSGIAFATPPLECSASVSPMAAHLTQTQAGARRRKPATPHRILCPSPIKTVAHVVSPVSLAAGLMTASSRRSAFAEKDQMSPRKSQRHLTSMIASASLGSKTRRKLMQPKELAPKEPMSTKPTAMTLTKKGIRAKDSAQLTNGVQATFKVESEANEEDIAAEAVVVISDDDDHEHDQHRKPDQDIEPEDQEFKNLADGEAGTVCSAKAVLNSAKHPTAQQNTTNNYNNYHNNNLLKSISTKGKTHPQPKMKQMTSAKSLAATNGNRELTEFFPVRRSVRKTKSAVKEEMMRSLEEAVLEERADGLKVEHFQHKGRGVVAKRRFQRGEFVIEYVGDLISMTEAAARERRYALDENAGCYMYYFKHKNQQHCIDATVDSGKLGRLVNHSRNGNLITKVVVVKQRPHLILVAKDHIEPGEELTYDYGDRSKESLLHHPWLAF